MILLLICCYISQIYRPNEKIRNFFYGRWYVNLAEVSTWILFFPFIIIFLSYVVCNKDIMDTLGLSCEISANRIFSICIAMFGLSFSILHEWWLSLFSKMEHRIKRITWLEKIICFSFTLMDLDLLLE